MSDLLAYALRAEYEGTVPQKIDGKNVDVPVFTGGVVQVDDETSLDIREALDEKPHEGLIVVAATPTNQGLINRLEDYPALKRVPAPAGAKAGAPLQSPTGSPALDTLGRTNLAREAKRRGLVNYSSHDRDTLLKALTEHDQRLAAGDKDAQPAPDHEVRITDDGRIETPADRAGTPGVNADEDQE